MEKKIHEWDYEIRNVLINDAFPLMRLCNSKNYHWCNGPPTRLCNWSCFQYIDIIIDNILK